jgi:phosphoribosyl 1,2-cyclic phosphate phosphodiesterase
MRFQILGSSAGKTVPRPFCRCRVCEAARHDQGRDVRTRCAVHLYLDGDTDGEPRYAIDLSPDVSSHFIRYGFALDKLEHLIFSHAHADHLDTDLLTIRPTILSEKNAAPHLHIYGSVSVGEKITALDLDKLDASFHQADPFVPFTAGELKITPLLGNHGPGVVLNHIVQHGNQTVLLAWDTGYWTDDSWERAADFTFDAVISECTIFGPGDADHNARHMNFATLVDKKERLIKMGCITDSTPWTTLHIGDNGGLTYSEQVTLGAPHGVTPGYDGMWFAPLGIAK